MKTSILVQNLKCGGCANTITNKLATIENISDLEIDIEESKISFSYLHDDDISLVKEKLMKIGYPLNKEENTIVSKAKSYISCATGKIG
jgi:copper chaperone CopZ